ncbi:uncharacterized protein SCHCODRAFT_01242929 [Schizophyllum commune H4-8]|uniref:uncharacterized protein n=1 Tax=Schizophyllum commune (strain H4-8 / FGSC 9210) TaxID=578458 RepID=UPI002160E7B3|nr:uncharacterized protein SCHCODRAFT_01242929 [Schizophyllum commune H4-8]KAI5886739.1 hypothetical protein SCHCODRAFT_01242929 [Schizophyllum commune H4-8]
MAVFHNKIRQRSEGEFPRLGGTCYGKCSGHQGQCEKLGSIKERERRRQKRAGIMCNGIYTIHSVMHNNIGTWWVSRGG